jgi:CheY-like chemotaxis protein
MTGLELVARLGPTPAFKVLFTSGYTDPKKLDGTLDDAQAFLAKPFSVQQLLHKVHELLMRSVSQSPPQDASAISSASG